VIVIKAHLMNFDFVRF